MTLIPDYRRSTSIFEDGCISTHANPYVHTPCDFTNGAYPAWHLRRRISTVMRAGRFVRFWASGGAKCTKMCNSLPWTPMNRRAKFNAASFILGGEIRNRTNTQKTNSKRYIHTLPISMCG